MAAIYVIDFTLGWSFGEPQGHVLAFVNHHFSVATIFNSKNLRKKWDEARIKSQFAIETILRQQFTNGPRPREDHHET